jgi:hypothetical protein
VFSVTNPKVIAELKHLAAANRGGEMAKAEAVINAARSKRSALHPYFPWDDSVAAHQHRLYIARTLLRVVVTYEKVNDKRSVACRVFVSLTRDRVNGDGGGYRVTHTVLSDPDLRAQLLDDARAEMKRFIAKYRKLTELAEVFAAMDKLLD